ncbi:MAG: type II toxin-antitoxin system Phd/YefM family antitoxin, partial [Bacteroidales bacterium]|nr:type II toxin-antitoxin system Phd/YefM family antitoxin [Bacteroidales bacterium]
NGSAVVIMSMEEYESMVETAYIMSQPDLVDAIRQGDEDVKNGNYEIVDVDEL